jgi:hypothetical protein
MPSFHFFTNTASLLAQSMAQQYGPVPGSETTHFQVTSLLSSSTQQTAYAVCAGKIFAQESGGRINLVLKPSAQPSGLTAAVKYYIYKGLTRDSLVDSANANLIAPSVKSDLTLTIHISQLMRNTALDALTGAQPGTTTTLPPINAVGLHLTAAAAAPNTLPDGDFVDDVFERLDDDEFPSVSGGATLGQFDLSNFGFEVIFDSVGDGPKIQSLRSPATIITAGNAGSTDVDQFRDDARREEILNYMDPCAFYGAFFFDGVGVRQNPGDSVKTLDRSLLYNTVLAIFRTANTVYLDVRNEHNHSFNFYRNYTTVPGSWAEIHIRYDGGTDNVLDYHFQEWPIIAIPTGAFTNTNARKPSTVSLNLPRGDNNAPIVLRTQGYFFSGFRRMTLRRPDVSEIFRPVIFQPDDFTVAIAFSVPKLPNNTTVPSYIGIRYLKRIGFTSPPADPTQHVLRARHFVDNLFELNSLLSANGLEIPLNTNDVSRWHTTGRTAVLAPDNATDGAILANIGVGDDQFNIYFFAGDPTANLLTGSSNTLGPLDAIGTAHGLDLGLRQIQVPDDLHVSITVPIGSLLPPFEDTTVRRSDFNIDERAIVVLALDRSELAVLQQVANSLEDAFDRRLVLRNPVDSKDGDGVVTATQYDLFVAGYQLGTTVAGKEIDTHLRVRHKAELPSVLASAAAIANFHPADPIDANRKRFAGSTIAKGTIVFLRSSPRLPKWNETSNLIVETEGGEHRVTVLGKIQVHNDNKDDDPSHSTKVDRTWYYVELLDQVSVTFMPIVAGGTRCWIGIEFTIVSTFEGFLTDLIALNKSIDAAQTTPEPLLRRLTRMRMRTKERGILSDMFDALIDAPPLGPPDVVRRQDEAEQEPIPRTLIDGYNLETSMRLFEDYMAVTMGLDQRIDIHHLLIGTDVVNHENPTTQVDPAIVSWLLTLVPKFDLGNNVDATTWAGDIGSVPADVFVNSDETNTPGVDSRWQTKWIANHPGATDREQEEAFADHYWETRAKDEDLYADVYCHLVRDRILRQLPNDPGEGNVSALLYFTNLQLRREGDRKAFQIFARRLGLDPLAQKRYQDYPDTVIAPIGVAIYNFAYLWYLNRARLPPTLGILADLQRWSKALALVFLNWLDLRR